MLRPDHRRTLVDSLRPLPGSRLDCAVGTTYTLNLSTLLVVPAAYALFDPGSSTGDDEQAEALTPIGLLDALHRTAGRITVFCDAAQIAPPLHRRRALLGFIEQAVVPVTAPEGGAFHPKLWALRYLDPSDNPTYRLLVGTRNLTFDRCWDTMTVLESDPTGEPVPGLGDIIRGLPDLAVTTLPDARHKKIMALADELDAGRFAPPDGFGGLRLHAFGLGRASWPFPESCDRLLVVSPFLSAGTLQRLPQAPTRRALVSRAEALSATSPATEAYECFTLNSAVVDSVPVYHEASRDDPGRTHDGLHAKLYVADDGDETIWWTGSANATTAAFERNVEVLLEMRTTAHRHSARALLHERTESDPEARNFQDLLVSWEFDGAAEAVDHTRDELDEVRRALAAIGFTATVAQPEPGQYDVTYRSDQPLAVPPDVEVRCWPATVAPPNQSPILDADGRLVFSSPATITTLSAFLVVELTLGDLRTAFVMRCEMVGGPEDRQQRLVAELLGDMHRLLRYLLAVLTDDDLPLAGGDLDRAGEHDWASNDLERLPLVEVMVKALAREPRRLRDVADTLATVRDSGTPLPDGLDELWDAVWQIAQEDTND